MSSLESIIAKYQQEEQADAEARGMTMEQVRAEREAESRAREEEQARKDERAKKCRNLAAMRRHMPADAFESVVSGTLTKTPTLSFVKRFLRAEKHPPICVLTGGTGCGKTIAAAWAVCLCPGAEYVHARDLAARYIPYSHDEARGITPLDMDAPLLVLDDVGTERWSRDGKGPADDRFIEALSTIIETRQNRDTIIITNKTQEGFLAAYCVDPRDMSRMMGLAAFCKGGAEDLRRA